MPRRNRKLVPKASQALEQMKYEIAMEFGVQIGADQTSRVNGSVGGEMVKRMITLAESQLGSEAMVPMSQMVQPQVGSTSVRVQ